MSGHSKWASIKRKKEKNDQAKGKVFSRHAREITVAARDGGGNPDLNPRLRLAVQKAKSDAMPADNIERAIKKGTGELEGEQYEDVTYEGYGPGGIALMIDTLTDNRNRTVGEIRAVFNKLGGNLGESGCVGYQFATKGVIQLDRGDLDEDDVLMAVLDAGAEDLKAEDAIFEITCAPTDLNAVVEALEAAGMPPADYEVTRVPQTTVAVDADQARKLLRLVDALDDLDDVQKVHGNFDIDEGVLEELSAG